MYSKIWQRCDIEFYHRGLSWFFLYTPLVACLFFAYADERNLDQVTPSMGEQSSPSSSSSTAGEVVKLWTQSLDAAEVPEALLSAQHIVAHVLGVPRVSPHPCWC